ncbi:MAG: hypothetical protein ACFFCE_02545 [Promethearchaeota archaeon]
MSEFSEFIEYKEGNIPLIISVPHGGILECDSIPNRKTGVLGIDKSTIEFSRNLIFQISQKFKDKNFEKKNPYHIFSLIRRSKIDLNRLEKDAFNQESLLAKEIYNFYHSKIKDWILNNLKSYNHSFLIDIHGFEKYNRPPGFRDVDVILGTNNLESFFPESIPKRNWGNNIRGKIIQKFLEYDISIAPGHPRRREYILTGGYITQTYGASLIPKSQTIQIEISDEIRIYNEELRKIVIKIFVDILFEDLKDF